MEDYAKKAQEWFAEVLAAVVAPDGSPDGPTLERKRRELEALLQGAYDDGVLAGRADKDAGEPVEVLTNRREDELLRRTEKILGAGQRTVEDLLQSPPKLRAVAQHARVEVKILRDFLAGRRTRELDASLIRRSFRHLDIDVVDAGRVADVPELSNAGDVETEARASRAREM